MFQGSYEKLLGRISNSSGLSKEDIERKVEAKRAKLSGLISKEGAAQIIASELGISFENEKLKIDELLPGMKKANTIGKVITLFPVREFEKQGNKSKVTNLIIADETSNIKVVLWDTNHIELIELKKIKEGDVVEIFNASMRERELHLGSFSEIKLSQEILPEVKYELIRKEDTIDNFKTRDNSKTRAFIVQIFEPRFFNVCPNCSRKTETEGENYVCQTHGKIIPEQRAILNMVLDDGTENIRAVLFSEAIKSLGIRDIQNSEMFSQEKRELLGKEMIFSGDVRKNKFFNNDEFIIDKAEEIDIDNLIAELETK